jgi:hypothetical protein
MSTKRNVIYHNKRSNVVIELDKDSIIFSCKDDDDWNQVFHENKGKRSIEKNKIVWRFSKKNKDIKDLLISIVEDDPLFAEKLESVEKEKESDVQELSFEEVLKTFSQHPLQIGPYYKFKFGKHIGKTALEVFSVDLNYCEWLLKQRSTDNKVFNAQRSVLNMAKFKYMSWKKDRDLPRFQDIVLDFGKHKGEKLSTVYDTDMDYLEWLLNTPPLYESHYETYSIIEFSTFCAIKANEEEEKTQDLSTNELLVLKMYNDDGFNEQKIALSTQLKKSKVDEIIQKLKDLNLISNE